MIAKNKKGDKVDVTRVVANFGVSYFEDVDIVDNENENEEVPALPCFELVRIGRWDAVWRWIINVDVNSGKILNWDGKTKCRTFFRVRDDAEISVYGHLNDCEEEQLIVAYRSYVPTLFEQDNHCYGDNVYLTINADGTIKKWVVTDEKLKNLLIDSASHSKPSHFNRTPQSNEEHAFSQRVILANAIYPRMIEQGLSTAELSSRIGCSESKLSSWLNANGEIDLDAISALESVLNVKLLQ